MNWVLASVLISLCGCAMSPTASESTREIVLEYIGGNVGTAGPFSKQGKKELDVLSAKDKSEASALIDRGAVGYLIYEPAAKGTTRIILVLKGKVVADYRAANAEPAQR